MQIFSREFTMSFLTGFGVTALVMAYHIVPQVA